MVEVGVEVVQVAVAVRRWYGRRVWLVECKRGRVA